MIRSSIFIILISLTLLACGTTEGPPVGGLPLQDAANFTANTVRLPGRTPEEQAIILTQTVYPATREDNAVGAIILCPPDEEIAFTAMNRITHMPVNAPLLYLTEDGEISEATLREMRRLRPDGVLQDERTDVYAVNVPEEEIIKVKEMLGYRVRSFNETDPIQLAGVAGSLAGRPKSGLSRRNCAIGYRPPRRHRSRDGSHGLERPHGSGLRLGGTGILFRPPPSRCYSAASGSTITIST